MGGCFVWLNSKQIIPLRDVDLLRMCCLLLLSGENLKMIILSFDEHWQWEPTLVYFEKIMIQFL